MDCSGPGGWRTLHLGVGPLVCPGWGCLCGGAPCSRGPGALSVWLVQRWLFPCLRSGCPAVSLSDRCSGSELVCLCVRVCVCVCVGVSFCLRISLGIYGGVRVGMFYHCCF